MNVQFAPQAEADLVGALAYVRARNPRAAEKLSTRIFVILEMLAHGDFRGQEQRLTTGELVSSWPVPPFRIYYRITGDVLQVLRVYHRARKPIAR